MRQIMMRRFTVVCLVLGFAVWLAPLAIAALDWAGSPTSSLASAATTTMLVTVAVQLAFIVAQTFPEGRQLIRIRFLGPDAWLAIVTFTMMPGVLWHYLAGLSAPFMRGVMPGFLTPAITALLFMIARLIQQGNYRQLRAGSPPRAV
ncbi:MAG: hypothetical protein M3Z05_17865 [Gemmatimonadota bacterium]|nr:hypothetical protein [Gemmatimonadota bacterium]